MTQLKGFKLFTSLVLVFQKIESKDKTKFDNFYSSSKAEIITNESDINEVFQSIYNTIITKKFEVGLLIQSFIILLVVQNIIL